MRTLLDLGLTNAIVATGMALVAAFVGRLCRRPALTHSLWLLVLLKLLTPAFVPVPLPWSIRGEPAGEEWKNPPAASLRPAATSPADMAASLDRLQADIEALRPSARPVGIPADEGAGEPSLAIE